MLSKAHRMIGRFLATFGLLLISVQAEAARFQLDIGGEGDGHEGSAAIKMMVILTLLSLAPAMLLTMTSFCSNFGRSDALADSARYADLTPSAGVDGSFALSYGCDYVAGWFRDV